MVYDNKWARIMDIYECLKERPEMGMISSFSYFPLFPMMTLRVRPSPGVWSWSPPGPFVMFCSEVTPHLHDLRPFSSLLNQQRLGVFKK